VFFEIEKNNEKLGRMSFEVCITMNMKNTFSFIKIIALKQQRISDHFAREIIKYQLVTRDRLFIELLMDSCHREEILLITMELVCKINE
jgi:hypothetical protein